MGLDTFPSPCHKASQRIPRVIVGNLPSIHVSCNPMVTRRFVFSGDWRSHMNNKYKANRDFLLSAVCNCPCFGHACITAPLGHLDLVEPNEQSHWPVPKGPDLYLFSMQVWKGTGSLRGTGAGFSVLAERALISNANAVRSPENTLYKYPCFSLHL